MEALVLMATEPTRYRTSQSLAQALATNPVVVRRLLASLGRAGLVASTKGPGGGTQLLRSPKQITLRDIYRALGPAELLHRSTHDSAGEKEIRKAVHAALRRAEKSFEQELDATTLNQVIKRAGLKAAKPASPEGEKKTPAASVPPPAPAARS